jgi:PadR family transcriptional regulator PadR
VVARRRPGMSTLAVLQAVAAGHRYGFDIMDATGLPGGTVYPALSRLERDRHLESRWEDVAVAQREKRPARRYYALSRSGRALLEESLAWLRGVAEQPEGSPEGSTEKAR